MEGEPLDKSSEEVAERDIREIDQSVKNYTIFDTDFHVIDASEDVAEYIDDASAWKRRFEQTAKSSTDKDSIPSFWPTTVGSRPRYGRIQRDHDNTSWEKSDILSAMDYLSTNYTILIGMQVLMYGEIAREFEDGRTHQHALAYTRRMLDSYVDSTDDIYMLLPIPYEEPDRSAEFIDD